MSAGPRVVVVGGGITGLAAALALCDAGAEVIVREADDRLGGKISSSEFAGVAGVDEGPDAFLRRVPDAIELARRVGLGAHLTSPTAAGAAVWHDGLHRIPDGLLLGVPASFGPLARSRLLSWRGKARAALEPLLPRSPIDHDSIGRFVRARFGDEVHERLVDALVGSIYATDTDRFSLTAVPQLADLAGRGRSLLLTGRRLRRVTPAPDGAVFATPSAGMSALVEATAAAIVAAGGVIHTGRPVEALERDGARWRVDGESVHHVLVTSPARATSPLLASAAPEASRLLGTVEHCDVIIVTLAVPAEDWPERLHGLSGYLVPKPFQGLVTAASFGSQKWAHWRPADGSQILRVSLGRDGLAVSHLDDHEVVTAAIDESSRHLGIDLRPVHVRISRWPAAFPQYRPHHHDLIDAVDRALPPGLLVAGASCRGIGIPACIRDGRRAASAISATMLGGGARTVRD